MSVCDNIKIVTRRHEWVADLFSVLAVALLFASIWAVLEYNAVLLDWMRQRALLHTPVVVGAGVLDVFVIFGLLCVGATHCEGEGCFRTFRGRRHGAGSLGKVFSSWLHHMEHVGRKHR
jgi:hypothetical protein